MFRWLIFGWLGVWAASSPAEAQGPGNFGGPALNGQGVQRLPPVESQPARLKGETAAEFALPPEETVAESVPGEAGPDAEEKLWEGSLELGLDGSQGNTETFNFQFGFDAKRKTKRGVLALDLDYRKKTNRSMETANRAFFDWRYERSFGDSRWTSFVHGTVDYDEFQAFDVRVTSDTGLGYRLIKTEATTLAARFGGGVSHEIGGPDDAYVPEAVFGLDFERRLSERHKLTASINYTPDVTGMNDFRVKTQAAWEALIDREMNLSLKLSVLDRYDSTPNGVDPNDLDYSAMLLWKF